MEFEVRLVGGIESCFVSLPLPLIQTLQSTAGGILPPVLGLELRSRDGGCWKLAWSGSASRSPVIEVSKHFAECISLVDHTNVHVKVVANLPRAVLVTIEPNDEDDWEILELNSELAEEAILKQVGIVHEGMRFPLWLHGHTVVLFRVISMSPEKSVVQLVPGTEVAVAPKRRKNSIDSFQDINKSPSTKEQMRTKGLLRVQAQTKKISHKFEFKDFELGVVLTCAAFIHPETARNLSFDNLKVVKIFPRLSMNEKMWNLKDGMSGKGSNSVADRILEASAGSKGADSGSVTVNLLFSATVAKGHIMLPESLRLFLKAEICSWVYVKGYTTSPRKDAPFLTLSPCRFKFSGRNKSAENNSTLVPDRYKNSRSNKLPQDVVSRISADTIDWSLHEELINSLSRESCNQSSQVTGSKPNEIRYLICSWLIGQLKAIASHAGETSISSVVLSSETLFHFELMSNDFADRSHQLSAGVPLGNSTGDSTVKLLYLLTAAFEGSSLDGLQNCFELSLNFDACEIISPRDLHLAPGKLELGEPVSLDTIVEPSSARSFGCTVSSLSWMEEPISHSIGRLTTLLSPSSQKLLDTFHLPLPGHVLIHGPPGSGKTSLATAIAKYFEEHEEILAHIIFISCSKLSLEKDQTIRQTLSVYVSEALSHSPSLIIFDDLDFLFSSTELEGSQTSNATVPLMEFLTDEKGQNACGLGPIAFMGSAQSITKLPQSLCSSGRFDFHIQLPAPAASERGAILKHELHKRSLECSEDILSSIASKCDGYDAYDLEILVDRAVHAASRRFLPSHYVAQEDEKPTLVTEDFVQAMNGFVPVAMRGLTKPASEGGRSGWGDVGGLNDVQKAIQEMVEFPSKFPNIFAQAPLRIRSNVLLYGPPGCGKTHIVGAAAAACSLRFISIKGPELLNKYIGASEQAVRDLFTKAAAAAPCLLFFDEFDSIAPRRGHDNTGVTDRVVNQLLTELDGVEALTGVFVFAATSRPDLLDAALLRPGRLDRLLFCGFPSWHERLAILQVLSQKLPLASDVNLEAIASMTEGFSGADLQALLSDAQLASVHELLDHNDAEKTNQMPARPSISEAEKQRLDSIYSNFLDSKKSVTAQSRDAKGKRATLA
ncbi:unnamed protein product [Spirodela intermedia]|uniref:Peroxisomal ATPase PEX1 n=1 Tax=Spirodela intermedia TaxID=51605 RepID=A0A7I8JNT8_SPIIN|nr:unnamed protein product [Spirodela intermedia]CAA6671838.1 unnamed protein product [Spirodela intermedia]